MDAYTKNEASELASAVSDLCDPTSSSEWSSAGIYSFWDYYTKEILYIGLAVDLGMRFKQHNGIIKVKPSSCKKKQIDEYFNHKDKLGYTIFTQSSLSQPVTCKNQELYSQFIGELDQSSSKLRVDRKDIEDAEAILLEIYRQVHSSLPKWNKIRGLATNIQTVTPGNYELIKCINTLEPNPLVSKSTIRELCEHEYYCFYEIQLHAIRWNMLYLGVTWEESLKILKQQVGEFFVKIYDEMQSKGYLKKEINL
ncbi:hypothetical protein Ga0466249_005223 [Sporomusaceae bacterium BoRhaA]|nr:hypothetical protein [Pelorhabdus rhamnosifermentans]